MSVSRFTLPRPLRVLVSRLPQFPHSAALCLGLNALLKPQLIELGTFEDLEGRSFAIAVEDAGIHCRFTVRGGRFVPLSGSPETDLTISANVYQFYQLATRQEDPDTLFFNRVLMMEGDTELGLIVKNSLDALEPLTVKNILDRLPRPNLPRHSH